MRADSGDHAARPATLADYAELARSTLDRGVWDFVAGGAGGEGAVTANTAAFEAVRLSPRVLSGVDKIDLSTRLLGGSWGMPVAVAPMAHHTMVHPDGEVATVRAANRFGVPVVVSTFAGRTFEELAEAATTQLWLQLYCFRDRGLTRDLVERAAAAGFGGVVLTVDCPKLARRPRDIRNGLRLPGHVRPVNLPDSEDYTSSDVYARSEMDPGLDWSIVEWLKSVASLPVLLKGILTAADAACAVRHEVDGIIVSNHGGRQLEAAPATLDALPGVAEAVGGRCPVLVDGGVRRGCDIAAALAYGADAVLVGRPVLHGLAVAGEEGASAVLDILANELTDVMLQTGRRNVAELDSSLLFGTPAPRAETRPASPEPARAEPAPPAPSPMTGVLAREGLHASVSAPVMETMNFLNEITMRYPGAISFAPGRPAEDLFETEQIFRWLRGYIDHLAGLGQTPEQIRTALFQYGATAGQIRDLVARTLADDGMAVDPADIVVTVGAQEAMFLVLRALFASPRDVLLVASPCYVGITGAARMLDIAVVEVPEGPDGLTASAFEEAVAASRARGENPRACYLVPDFSNPSGSTLPLPARHDLLAAATHAGVILIEDTPYRLVSPIEAPPTLKALDQARCVVHIGSFAKSAFPGARLGYLIADQDVVSRNGERARLSDEICKLKSMLTVNSPSLSQAAVAGLLLESGFALRERNAAAAAHYGANMDAVTGALSRFFPESRRDAHGVTWNQPAGGFFLAVNVPFAADDAALEIAAEQYEVIWTPMRYFHPGRGGENVIRLAWSYITPEQAEEGIGRLAAFITDHTARTAAPPA